MPHQNSPRLPCCVNTIICSQQKRLVAAERESRAAVEAETEPPPAPPQPAQQLVQPPTPDPPVLQQSLLARTVARTVRSARKTTGPAAPEKKAPCLAVIRGRKREHLPAFDCPDCAKFYFAAGLVPDSCNHVAGRHRGVRGDPENATPDGYWRAPFPA